jgi:tetratricopeptide (TPR) repeat protein
MIFVIAFAVRIANLEIIKNNPFFNSPTMDEKYNDDWAHDITRGHLFSNAPFYRAPAYPFFLGLVYAIFSNGYYIARLFGLIIGAFSCVFIYLVGRELFSHSVGLIAALLACFYGMFLFYDAMLLTVYLEILFSLLALFWLLKWLKHRNSRSIFISGVFWGLASITRPNFLIFVPVIAVYVLLAIKDIPMNARLKYVLLLIAGLLPSVIPVILINVLIGKDFVPIAWNGGINFFLGNNPSANGWSATSPELDATWWGGYKDAIIVAGKALHKEYLLPSQVSNYWFIRGINYIFTNPLGWLGLMLKKVYLLLNSFELSNNQSIQGFQQYSFLLRIPLLNYGTILALAIWGIICSVREKNKGTFLTIFFLVAYSFSIVIFFVCARYRIVLVPFLLIFASHAVIWIIRKIKEKMYRGTVLIIIGMIALIVFFNTDFYGTHVIDQSKIHESTGNRFFDVHKYSKAIEEYNKALSYDPKNTDAMNALGNTYMMLRQLAPAEKLFKASLGIKTSVDALCKLGIIYMGKNDMDSAKVYFDEAIAMNSTNPEVYYYTGMFYAYNKSPQLAIKYLETALGYYPDPKYLNNIYVNLSKLYLEIGNKEESAKYFQKASVKK